MCKCVNKISSWLLMEKPDLTSLMTLLPYCPGQARVGGYMEKLLKWFNYPHTRVHHRCEVSCHGTKSTCIVGSSMLHWGQPDSGEGCIVLQSGLTRSLIAKFPHVQSSLEHTNFVLQWKNAANEATNGGVCEPLNLWCLMSWCPKHIRTITAMWAQ